VVRGETLPEGKAYGVSGTPSLGSLPTVSVGIPVFNGADFLADAVESVLNQTFGDLELIICDNASTDQTAEICREYAGRDRRVRYFRNDRNLGAAPNFNRALAHARGAYFKWLAHDDRLAPSYLAATVAALEARPDALLCNTVVNYINASGHRIAVYDTGLGTADRAEPALRFAAMVLCSHSCVDFFGLIRRAAIPGEVEAFHGTDRAFLAQLALRGPLLHLPEPLVEMREHRGRYTRGCATGSARLVWHDTSLRGRLSFPTWRLFAEYLRMVRSEPLPPGQRAICGAVLAQWWVCNWNAARAGVDLIEPWAPGAVVLAEQMKVRLFGLAPGHFRDATPGV
jgi:glycosyltransferase involved in cell wall biosynthesis